MVENSADWGNGGHIRPCSATAASRSAPMVPGPQSTRKSSGWTAWTPSSSVMSRLTPPSTGTGLPSVLLPAAYGVTGTPRSFAAARTAETSAVEAG